MDGIFLFNGTNLCYNNVINLGEDISTGYKIYGIWDNSGSTNQNNIYFNTVFIGGTVSSGTTSMTSAIWNSANTSTRAYKNNIFYNARTGGSTGKHLAIYIAGTAGLTIDFNDYYSTSGVLGKISNTEKIDFTSWKATTVQDANSLDINPSFALEGGTDIVDYYASAVLPGVTIAQISTDYDLLTRGSTPKIGALEFNNYTWQGNTSTDFATASNWVGGVVPLNGANIIFAASPANHCVLDSDRTIKNILNNQGSKYFVINGKKLTLTGDLTFTNNAKIDGTATGSTIAFAGSTSQNLPSGALLNDVLDSLEINNENGFLLNGDLTLREGIAITKGNFNIGPNTLTFNGLVTAFTGTVTGGSSTNMIIGGNGATIYMPDFTLNNLTINRTSGVILGGDLSVVGVLALTSGTLVVGDNNLTISGSNITKTSGQIDASDTGATIIFNNASAYNLPTSLFVNAINNLTISGSGGIVCSSDIEVDGILNLASSNPTSTKGLLEMKDGATLKTLTMGAQATTIGVGDVTGIVKRISFVPNIVYSFGNPHTTVTFPNTGVLPSEWSIKISIGTAASWKSSAIQREYDIVRTGGSNSLPTIKLHYLDSELNGNSESELVFFGHLISNSTTTEYGKINANITDNWVSLSGNISFAPLNFGERFWTLSPRETPSFTWQGTVPGAETDWEENMNWVGGDVPSASSDVKIPAGCSFYPVLPDTASVNTILIEAGAILNSGSNTVFKIYGGNSAWYNLGLFNSISGNVEFYNSSATLTGNTSFWDLTISSGASIILTTGTHILIAGNLTNNGILDATEFPNTIEFNGDNQSIVNPNGPTNGYYNLVLSGNGIKTMPSSSLVILKDFSVSESATVTAANNLDISGTLFIDTLGTFTTGIYSHSLGGNFDNNGTFIVTSGNTIIMNGAVSQSIGGIVPVDFENLVINNNNGVTFVNNANETNTLTLALGNLNIGSTTFGINGTITKQAGFINVTALSSLIFGGTSGYTIPDNLFFTPPSLNNLTINRSGGVTLGNQDITINGLLELTSGILHIDANKLIINGISPTRSSGSIDAANSSASIEFSSVDPIILPASIFDGNVNNLIISGLGGVTAVSDFTISGILNLQAANPSSIAGCLNMFDGANYKTLSMGVNATTIGVGDVTGIIKRTTLLPAISYSFGNQFTTAYFANTGTLPTEMSAKITIGTEPTWKTGSIQREIEIIQTGGSNTSTVFTYHYLDSELNYNDEEHLVLWVKYGNTEYGRSAYNSINNWVSLTNVDVAFFSSSWDAVKNITLDEYSTDNTLTWNGSVSTSWTSVENWTPNAGPSANKNIIIPDASTTTYSPVLPSTTEISTLTINSGAILNSIPLAQLTVNGEDAWINYGGSFNASTSNVNFTSANATISGTTNFYDVTVGNGKTLWLTLNSFLRIGGTIYNSGTIRTVVNGATTVEYNGGSQVVIIPNSATNRYYNLVLSGTGVKTLPGVALNIDGDLTFSGNANSTASEALTITESLILGNGTTFNTGGFNHSLAGDFVNDGSFSQTSGNFQFNGNDVQEISGATTFYNLIVNNSSSGLVLNNNIEISNQLSFTDGNINLNGQIITIDADASLVNESNDNRIFGSTGYIQTTRNFNLGDLSSGINIGNLGLVLTTAEDVGTLTLKRGHEVINGGSSGTGKSITRYFDYDISSKGNSNLDATLKMYYFENELNGLDESELVQFQSSDNTNWIEYGNSTINIIDNYILTTGVDSLMKTTISEGENSEFTLPINLVSFKSYCVDNEVKIVWMTASEKNSDYFKIEKSFDLINYNLVGIIKASGNSNYAIEYSIIDEESSDKNAFYRLTSIDFNGHQAISQPITSNCFNGNSSQVLISPNPFVDDINLQIISEIEGLTMVNLYSSDGLLVFSCTLDISNSNSTFTLPTKFINPGFYTLQISNSRFNKSFKVIKL